LEAVFDLFTSFSFLKRNPSLEDKLKESLENKRSLELDIKKLTDHVVEFEKHVSGLEKTENDAKAVLSLLNKDEDSIKNSRQRRDTERRRWQSYKSLHFVEEKRFEMLGLLKEANTKLRSLHKALLDQNQEAGALEKEIEIEHSRIGHKALTKGSTIAGLPASSDNKEEQNVNLPGVSIALPILGSDEAKGWFGGIAGIHFSDLFLLSVRTFRTKFAMTMMTILGIGVSFATIFFLVSLGYGLEKLLLDQFASPILMRSLDVSTLSPDAVPLNVEAKTKIENLSGVEHVEPIFGVSGQLEFNNVSSEVEFRGASPKYFELSGQSLLEGRVYTAGEKAIIISSSFLQTTGKTSLSDFSAPVSIIVYRPYIIEGVEATEIVNLGSDFKVVGIYKDPDNAFAYLSPNFIEKMVPQYSSLKVIASDQKYVVALRSSISDMGLASASVLDTVDQATKVFSILEILLALFGAASLLVATIGMVNTMTVSLIQRTQEIGVMKVLGVANKDVRKLFLLEAAIIGGLGGLSGILMGIIFSQAFNFGLNFLARNLGGQSVSLFYYPPWFVIGVVGASFIIGVFTGVVPAQKAANMDPINAVKYK